MNPKHARIMAALLGIMAFQAAPLHAAENNWKKVPNGPIEVDLTSRNRERHAVFSDQGLVFEVTHQFPLVKHSQVSLKADLEAGSKFEVTLAGQTCPAQVRNVRVENATGTAEIAVNVAIGDFAKLGDSARSAIGTLLGNAYNKATEEAARQMAEKKSDHLKRDLQDHHQKVPEEPGELQRDYALASSANSNPQPLRDRLNELAKKRSAWLSADEPASWSQANGATLLTRCEDLLVYDLADEMLKASGLEVDTSKSNFRTLLQSRASAMYLLWSGNAAQNPQEAKKISSVFTPKELSQLHRSFNIKVVCRATPPANPDDGNSQWFDARRVACQAPGTNTISLSGSLDPNRGDGVDWWQLEGYRPQKTQLELPKQAGVRFEQYPVENGLRLRVVAVEAQPVNYKFKLITSGRSTDGPAVEIYESPDIKSRKFPF